MAQSGGGSIVNVSSISSIIAGHNLAAYNSAKAAVRHLNKSVAPYCAHEGNNIRSNSVHPVFIDTAVLDGLVGGSDRNAALEKLGRQIPLGRVGQPEDVAYAVLYLASDESAQDATAREEWHRAGLSRWASENPPGKGTGWGASSDVARDRELGEVGTGRK